MYIVLVGARVCVDSFLINAFCYLVFPFGIVELALNGIIKNVSDLYKNILGALKMGNYLDVTLTNYKQRYVTLMPFRNFSFSLLYYSFLLTMCFSLKVIREKKLLEE